MSNFSTADKVLSVIRDTDDVEALLDLGNRGSRDQRIKLCSTA